ncbi:DUF1441 family protein [Thiohalospira halophila]|uniref:DUF1441 family protein n=1 Tax=Thiohalospira halophila TaxID=381300 RepID=UPI0023DD2F34|nr:DUF1441 family protein [Thiohalospira halophila]
MASISEASLYSISRLARETGLARDTVRKRLASVQPSATRKGHPVYTLGDACPALFGAQGGGEPGDGPADPDQMDPSDRDRWYASEIRRLDYESKVGQLIPHEDVARTFAAAFKRVSSALDTLTDVVEREAGLSGHQVAEVQRVVDGIRSDLYAQLGDEEADDPEEAVGE